MMALLNLHYTCRCYIAAIWCVQQFGSCFLSCGWFWIIRNSRSWKVSKQDPKIFALTLRLNLQNWDLETAKTSINYQDQSSRPTTLYRRGRILQRKKYFLNILLWILILVLPIHQCVLALHTHLCPQFCENKIEGILLGWDSNPRP